MKKMLVLLLCLSVLCQPVSVYANSAQTSWRGVDATGALVVGENSPVIVEQEELVFDIHEFPLEYYPSEEEYLAYAPTATARYTFCNPANCQITVSLAFPFGAAPDYSANYYDAIDSEKFGVRVDGVSVDKKVRHTLSGPGREFNIDIDLPLLYDGYAEDGFYHPDLPVTVYAFSADCDFSAYNSAYCCIEFDFDSSKNRVFVSNANGCETTDSFVRVGAFAEEGKLYMLYIFGEHQEPGTWKFYENGSCKKEIEGSMKLMASEQMTFEEFVLEKIPADSDVLPSDWYNAVVASANQNLMDHGLIGLDFILGGMYNPSRYLMQWFTYDITFEPGQRIVNEVTVPMYPAIDRKYEPPVYEYTYLLSPASTWSEFGSLDIQINTPYYMVGENPFSFEKTDSGYAVSLDGLPDGELEFSLSTAANPEKPKIGLKDIFYLGMILFQLGCPLIVMVAVIVIICKIFKHRRKR